MSRRIKLLEVMLVLLISAVIMMIYGCSEDTPVDTGDPPYADPIKILCRPLAPRPYDPDPSKGDTIAVLSVPTSGWSSGEEATFKWEVSGGTLESDEGYAVNWNVPENTGTYGVKVTVRIGDDVDTLSTKILVRNFHEMDTGLPVNMKPGFFGDDTVFVGSEQSLSDLDFTGFHVYEKRPSDIILKTDCSNCYGCYQILYFPDEDLILMSMVQGYQNYFRQQLLNVMSTTVRFPFVTTITNDMGGFNVRKIQNIHPYGNEDVSQVVWQKERPGAEGDGSDDLCDIGFWSSAGSYILTQSIDTIITARYIPPPYDTTIYDTNFVYYDNIKPTITPDGDVLYFADSTRNFEPCMVDIDGNTPDMGSRRAIRSGSGGRLFGISGVNVSRQTVFEWNPTRDILGFVDSHGQLCFFDPYTPTLDVFIDIDGATEFAWSSDGDICAVICDEGILLVMTDSKMRRHLFEKEISSDEVIGVNWPEGDNSRIAFRTVRKGRNPSESYSALVIYNIDSDEWSYASHKISWLSEPDVDYTWLRVQFAPGDGGIYFPSPVWGEEDKEVVIYRSYE